MPNSRGARALALALLGLTSRLDGGMAAARHFDRATNMTDRFGALACLVEAQVGDEALAAFYNDWKDDALVLDKWFAIQVSLARPANAVDIARRLTEHPDFTWKNPNRFRAVLGALMQNPAGFHDPSGAGYAFYADWLLRLDPVNPQIAAKMSTAFDTWRRYDADRQGLIRAQLDRIRATPGLSRDLGEMVTRMLG